MILVFVLFIISRRVQESGNEYLDQSQKAGLVDLFTPLRSRYPIVILTLVVIFFANLYLQLIPEGIALSVYFFVLTFAMLYMAYLSYKVLVNNEYPKPYINKFIQSTAIRIAALLVLIGALTSS
jgi:4-hydroxybenzoate polyprenyltransferase